MIRFGFFSQHAGPGRGRGWQRAVRADGRHRGAAGGAARHGGCLGLGVGCVGFVSLGVIKPAVAGGVVDNSRGAGGGDRRGWRATEQAALTAGGRSSGDPSQDARAQAAVQLALATP